MLEGREVSSEQLVHIFGARIQKTGRELNLTTTELFEQAFVQARECDRLRREGSHKGILFGLPLTVKDCQHMLNVRTTCGNMSMAHHISQQDSLVVACLREQGAVFLARGNVPQMMYTSHTDSFWGCARNPH